MKNLWNLIVSFIRTEAEKLRPLTFKEKLTYIWDYYRLQIFLTVFFLSIALSLITTIIKAHTGGEVVFGVGIVNDYSDNTKLTDYISSGFGEYLEITPGKQQVLVNAAYTVTEVGKEYEEISSLLILVDAGSGNVDAVICSNDVIDYFHVRDSAVWLDLREILDEDALGALSDRLYYIEDDDGIPFPCGIYLRGTHLMENTPILAEDPLVAVISTAQHMDNVDDFVDWLMGWNAE